MGGGAGAGAGAAGGLGGAGGLLGLAAAGGVAAAAVGANGGKQQSKHRSSPGNQRRP